MTKMKSLFLILVLSVALLNPALAAPLPVPEEGAYVGAYVDAGPLSDTLTADEVFKFETLINKKLTWAYFSNNWIGGEIVFPKSSIEEAIKAKVVPYIRLMPWSEVRASGADPIFTMDALLGSEFDEGLRAWARKAKEYKTHYILEFGPEVNGDWFAWNGKWNGGSTKTGFGDPNLPDGPEKFQHVYRKIIDIFKSEGLENVTWVLHLDTAGSPNLSWNQAKNYYPGDDYIDWIGLSVFGAQLPTHGWYDFRKKIKDFWPQIEEIASRKTVIISEFAVIEDVNIPERKADWLKRALKLIEAQFYPIKGISYWNSPGWLADGSADFRLTSSIQAQEAFSLEVQKPFWKELNVEEIELK